MLNRGGFANPDVLRVERAQGPPLIVKDYARRSLPVRRLLARLLLRHELAMLERLAGLPGLPQPRGRIDALAFAIELIDGRALRRRSHHASLPPVFFDALEGILDGLAQRGVIYLDLSSSSNVLETASGAPALVDLASALRLPVPRVLRKALEGRALRKLRSRFLSHDANPVAEVLEPEGSDLDLGRARLRYLDRGNALDPFPALLLPEAGISARVFDPVGERASEHGRRALAVDLPGSGSSRVHGRALAPARVAALLERFLDALRIGPVDVVGWGWGGLVGRCLAGRGSTRVRALLTIDTPLRRASQPLLRRVELARRDPRALRAALAAELPEKLPEALRRLLLAAIETAPQAALCRAHLQIPLRDGKLAGIPEPERRWLAVELPERREPPADDGRQAAPRVCWEAPLADSERLWSQLALLGAQ